MGGRARKLRTMINQTALRTSVLVVERQRQPSVLDGRVSMTSEATAPQIAVRAQDFPFVARALRAQKSTPV